MRVREEPTVSSDEIGRVEPGNKFIVLDEAARWVKIEYEPGSEGWVSSTYTKEVNNQ